MKQKKGFLFTFIAGLLLLASFGQSLTHTLLAATLDGVRDASYGTAIGTDPASDLANPGPGAWTGTAWTDQRAIYCSATGSTLYIYADLPNYAKTTSTGQIGLAINTKTGGGTTDPWGTAITFGHSDKPDYLVRSNIPGINPDDNGWTELRSWSGTAWSAGGTNWGGITSGQQIGSKIAYANSAGVEFAFTFSELGIANGATIGLELFAAQAGATKGAYDTVPSDDQSTGWDDATTLINYATCTVTSNGTEEPTPTPVPTTPSVDVVWSYPSRTAFIQLFEWKWTDIALECENWLGPKGFKAIQISPPNENRVNNLDNYPWHQRYQPMSYILQSRSGSRAELIDMIQRCDAVGVKIIADTVINHMAGLPNNTTQTGSAGTSVINVATGGIANYPTDPGQYSAADDFNYDLCSTGITNWCNRWQVTYCELVGLDDLDTGKSYVQDEIAAYLNDLVNIGVWGFRVDAAKHIPESELGAILAKVNESYNFLEVIQDDGCLFDGSSYTPYGDVTEFRYGFDIASKWSAGNLAGLQNIGSGKLGSDKAVVFIDNHDTQRGHFSDGAVGTYAWGNAYTLMNVFMLGHPYGEPVLMSSYAINASDKNEGPPSSGAGVTESIYTGSGVEDVRCRYRSSSYGWICEQRWLPIANMVGFRNFTEGQPLTNWTADGTNRIAFSRGSKGWLAINNTSAAWTSTFNTSLPAGTYCNITVSNILPTSCEDISSGSVEGPLTITVNGSGQASVTIPAYRSAAIHTGLPELAVPTATTLGQTATSSSYAPLLGMGLFVLLVISFMVKAGQTRK